MENIVEITEYKGFAIIVGVDDCCINPREDFDHLFKFAFNSRSLTCSEIDDFVVSGAQEWIEEHNETHYIFSVYAYLHGQVALSMEPYQDPWDSGLLGIACVEKKAVHEEFGGLPVDGVAVKEQLSRNLKAELDEYQAYLNGDIFYYRIVPVPEAREELPPQEADQLSDLKVNKIPCDVSCGGFFGDNFEQMFSIAREEIDWAISNYREGIITKRKKSNSTQLPGWVAKRLRQDMRKLRLQIKQLERRSKQPVVRMILGDSDVDAYCKFRTQQLEHILETIKDIYSMKKPEGNEHEKTDIL